MTEYTDKYPDGCFIAFNWSIDRISSAKLVEAVVNAHTAGFSQIHLILSSTGGFLSDAFYAAECIRALPCELSTYNVASVQSAANVLFSLGHRRFASKGATFFFHQTGFEGVPGQRSSEKEVREQLRVIEEGDARTAAYIADQLECDPGLIAGWQRESKTLTTAEALAMGVIEAIQSPQIGPKAWVRQVTLQP